MEVMQGFPTIHFYNHYIATTMKPIKLLCQFNMTLYCKYSDRFSFNYTVSSLQCWGYSLYYKKKIKNIFVLTLKRTKINILLFYGRNSKFILNYKFGIKYKAMSKEIRKLNSFI